MPVDQMTQEQFVANSIDQMHAAAVEGARFRAAQARDEMARIALEPAKPVTPSYHETAASVAHLVDTDGPAKAYAAYVEATERQAATGAAVVTAEKTLNDAMAARETLAVAAASGETVTARQAAAGGQAVRDAEAHLAFLQSTVTQLHPVVKEAHDAHGRARGLAHMAVLDHGIDLRIAAAAKWDVAHLAMLEAERDFAVASDLVAFATLNGARSPAQPHVGGGNLSRQPQSEARERAFWKRTQ
jgi:hypothetical protein